MTVRKQIDQQQAEIATAKAAAQQARFQLAEAEDNRQDLIVTAPFDGTVMTRAAEPGEVVAGRHRHRHAARSEQGLSARIRAGRADRQGEDRPARARLSRFGARQTDRRLCAAHRSAGHVHAGEYLLPRRPREAGGGREAAAQRRASDSPNPACRPMARSWSRAKSGRQAGSTNDGRRFHTRGSERSRAPPRARTGAAGRSAFAISGSATARRKPCAASISKSATARSSA